MVKRTTFAAAALVMLVLVPGCGDPLVNGQYLGQPKLRRLVQMGVEGSLVMAWLSASFQFEGAQGTVRETASSAGSVRFEVFDSPDPRYVHEFSRVLPGAQLAFGVWLWVTPRAEELTVVNNIVQGGRLLSIGSEPVVYVADAGSTHLVAGAYYELVRPACPAEETGFAATGERTVLFPSSVDAGVPMTAALPDNCVSP